MDTVTARPSTRQLSDQQQQWLADLYEANFRAVFRICNGVLRSTEDAADAAHETFLIAANSMQPDVAPNMARSWLLTVARNHCLDVLRRRKRFGRALVTLGGNPDNSTDMESAIVDRDFASGVLSRLSAKERQALWQSAVESRPLADIALGLQLNYMAAAQVLHRARRHAAITAARFAALIGMVRVAHAIRRNIVQRSLGGVAQTSFRSLGATDRILALAAVPLIIVAIQSSSSASPSVAASINNGGSASTIAAPASTPGVGSTLALPSPSAVAPLTGSGPAGVPATGSLVPGATSAMNGAVGSIDQSIGKVLGATPTIPAVPSLPLPSATAPPLPTPTLPPIVP